MPEDNRFNPLTEKAHLASIYWLYCVVKEYLIAKSL